MPRRKVVLTCILECFLSFAVARSLQAQQQTPAELLEILLAPVTPDGLWQSTSDAFQKLPPETAIRTLFPEIAKGIPGGEPYATCGRGNPQVSKTLVELLAHPQSLYGQTTLLAALDSHNWVPEAEEPARSLFRNSENPPGLRSMAAFCLLRHVGAKYHSEVVQFALYSPEAFRGQLFHELASSSHVRVSGFDPIVPRMGFAQLFAELAKNEEARARGSIQRSEYGAFLYADHLGRYLGENFAPDLKLPQYQGEQEKEVWYRETVENALAWWSKNKELSSK